MRSAIPTFPTLLQRFFTRRLMQEKRVSANTISSYRDTFRLSTADEISPEGADENSSLRCSSVASVSAWGLDAFEF